IPKPFDPRLIERIAPAVAKAAMDSGVATRPLEDLEGYRQRMERFSYHSGNSMKPVFQAAKAAPKRVLYAEGEEERVLRAVQVVVDEGIAFPVLLGRADVIARRIETLGLRLKVGQTCEVVNILSDPRYPSIVTEYYELGRRRGVTQAIAKEAMRSRASLIAAMLLRRGDVDAMLCGTVGTFDEHLKGVREVIGCRKGVFTLAAMNMLMLPTRQIFICDTYVNRHPKAVEIAEMTLLAADEMRRFGVTPAAALLSHSSFGSSEAAEAQLMREALAILPEHDPDLVVDGEMQGDAALSKVALDRTFPGSRLRTEANLLIMPNVDAANIAYNLLKVTAGNGITVGPILLGLARPAHILEPGVTVRRIVNMTALATVDAGMQR
ncbi:MAG TPA: phosphate acyltransferase, partial [Hyphomicrobiaceae bacterium]|nr:phosphate acyltransferase [Hyphomicrobiaceae bacterium]